VTGSYQSFKDKLNACEPLDNAMNIFRRIVLCLAAICILDTRVALALVTTSSYTIDSVDSGIWDLSGGYAISLPTTSGATVDIQFGLTTLPSGQLIGNAHLTLEGNSAVSGDCHIKGLVKTVRTDTTTSISMTGKDPNLKGSLTFLLTLNKSTKTLEGTVSGSLSSSLVGKLVIKRQGVTIQLPTNTRGFLGMQLFMTQASSTLSGYAYIAASSDPYAEFYCSLSGNYNDLRGQAACTLVSKTNLGINLKISFLAAKGSNALLSVTGVAFGEKVNIVAAHPSDLYMIPCGYAGGTGYGVNETPGSQYANYIISLACQFGKVSMPANGVWEVIGLSGIGVYDPLRDRLEYDPNVLNNWNFTYGAQEAGDSVLYHETGHNWAAKTGIMGMIGYGSIEQSWNQEFQADSYAGWVLRNLGGNALPSVNVYSTVMANWSTTHPPGAQRAQVFYSAWYYDTVTLFVPIGSDPFPPSLSSSASPIIGAAQSIKSSPEELMIIQKLQNARNIRKLIEKAKLNPYDRESDSLFQSLLKLSNQ
jgi:hypothetical protein